MSDFIRNEERKEIQLLADKVWPGATLEVVLRGSSGRPSDTVEVRKQTTFGELPLFRLRADDAAAKTVLAFRAMLGGSE